MTGGPRLSVPALGRLLGCGGPRRGAKANWGGEKRGRSGLQATARWAKLDLAELVASGRGGEVGGAPPDFGCWAQNKNGPER
jgi:hypothetical protein